MTAANLPRTKAGSMGLMEAVCERGNLFKAYERVVKNKGATGVDDIGIPEFKAHLQKHWPAIAGIGVGTGNGTTTSVFLMNRRMRNRTYGGVRGRRERSRPLLDALTQIYCCCQ